MSDSKWTPGPWVWTYNQISGFALTTPDRGRLYVMDFGRQGMQGATPRFSYWEGLERGRQGGIMMDASHYLTNEGAIDHPDAHLIAAASELAEEHQQWSEEFGQALMAVMQEDYGPITELAMRMPFDFHDIGSPTLRSAALSKARGES